MTESNLVISPRIHRWEKILNNYRQFLKLRDGFLNDKPPASVAADLMPALSAPVRVLHLPVPNSYRLPTAINLDRAVPYLWANSGAAFHPFLSRIDGGCECDRPLSSVK